MAESALFRSYRETQHQRARQVVDEALARLEATEQAAQSNDEESQFQSWYAGHSKKLGLDPNPDAPEHKYDYRGAFKAGAGPGPDGHWPSQFKADDHPNRFVGGMDTKTGERAPGVFESIKRGLQAIPDRFYEGLGSAQAVADAIYPATPDDTRSAGQRLKEGSIGLLGTLNVVFPFAAFAGETGGDFHEWLARASGDLTTEKLVAARAHAEQHAPGTVPLYDALLGIPYKERVQRTREAGAMSAELLAGVIPGYTGR